MPKTELFVGNLNKEITRQEIEDVFDKYGKLVRCDVKNRGKPKRRRGCLLCLATLTALTTFSLFKAWALPSASWSSRRRETLK